MKRIILTVLFVSVSAVWGNAQQQGSFGLIYRFDPVPRMSTEVDDLLPTSFRTGVSHGVGAHYQATDTFALQALVRFGSGTYTQEVDIEDGTSYKETAQVGVFGIEALAPYYFLKNGNVSAFLAPGVSYSSFSYEDEFDSEDFWSTEVEVRYRETNLLLQLGGQAVFGNFGVFSSYGLSVNLISINSDTRPSETGLDVETETKTTGIGITSSQFSVGLLYILN
jgi:hypothetical protein